MYVEKRKSGKQYLVYSYRENGKVKKIRKYLGKNLSDKELKKAREKAEKELKSIIEELRTEVFNFSLTKNQIKRLNKYKIEIVHLEDINWTIFTEEFVYNTNAIEGSTASLEEVKDIIENKRIPENTDEIEAENVARAINFIRKTKEKLSLELIKKLHKICFEDTEDFAGEFRNVEVVITDAYGSIIHKGVSSEEITDYMEEMVEWYEGNKEKFKPIVLAAIMHNQFEHIHPFQDGNGRVGRLLLNLILIKNNYPPINIFLKDRKKYYEVLKEYSNNQNIKQTVEFLINQYKKTLKRVTTKGRKRKM